MAEAITSTKTIERNAPVEAAHDVLVEAMQRLDNVQQFQFGAFTIFQGDHPEFGFVQLIEGAFGVGAMILPFASHNV